MLPAAVPTTVPYNPRKIYVASFLGGPLAAHWFISKNFLALADAPLARRFIWLGSLIVVAMIPLILLVPTKTPDTLIPLLYSYGYYLYAKRVFGADSVSGYTAVGWREWMKLMGISLSWMALTLAVWFAGVVAIAQFFPAAAK